LLLSFNKDDFAQTDFKVDEFIAKHRRAGVPLESLKEDLSLYLEVLETAMYDLINRDYQDFVSLSSNLVGLDTAIEDLSNPLNILKQDVSGIQNKMRETLQTIQATIEERDALRGKRLILERFLAVDESIQRLQSLLGPSCHQGGSSGDVLEEAAHRWIFLQTQLKCDAVDLNSLPFIKERKATIDDLNASLLKKTSTLFSRGLEKADLTMLRQSMRIYVIINKTDSAEDLFRQKNVAPPLTAIFDECVKGKNKSTSEILTNLYAKILEFVPSCLSTVKEVISSSQTSEHRTGNESLLRGYDFMCGAVWPEICHQLMTRVNNLFSPGNPDMFHANYTVTLTFLSRLEGLCTSQASVERLRKHKSHVTFLSKWNLSVYFQIRFQEIAGTFETALLEGWKRSEDKGTKGILKGTSVLLACLNVCWIPSVFLEPLLHRFWKLTLQLLSRYCEWMEELKSTLETKKEQDRETTPGAGEKSVGTVGSSGDVSASSSNPASSVTSSSSSPPEMTPQERLNLIVDLMSDVDLIRTSMTPLFDTVIWPRAHVAAGGDATPFRQCIDASCEKMKTKLEPFEELKEEAVERQIVQRVLTQICRVYLRNTGDVLTSVQKMEESLKRLKKARGGAGGAGAGSAATSVSDDDKIRLQLALDVKSFKSQVETSFRFDAETLEDFVELRTLVVEATAGLTDFIAPA